MFAFAHVFGLSTQIKSTCLTNSDAMSTIGHILAVFGAIHLVADIAILGFFWWWSREAAEDAAKASEEIASKSDSYFK